MNRLRDLDLKLPDLRMPLVLSDLFHDLRDRRLLPLVALIVVAVAAIPFLLSDSGSESSAPPVSTAPEAEAGAGAEAPRLTVVRVDHGLRVPHKRLGHLSPKDPFRQQYTGPAGGAAPVVQTSTSTSTGTTTSVPTESGFEAPGGGQTTSPSQPPSSGGGANDAVTVFTFSVDLKIVKTTSKQGGGKAKGEPETRERVLPPATLPGEKTQVLTYMGISPEKKKPLFLVSDEVTSVFGEADCVAGTATCHLLELEPGFPVTLLYGPNDVRYKFTVLKVEPVAAGHF